MFMNFGSERVTLLVTQDTGTHVVEYYLISLYTGELKKQKSSS